MCVFGGMWVPSGLVEAAVWGVREVKLDDMD